MASEIITPSSEAIDEAGVQKIDLNPYIPLVSELAACLERTHIPWCIKHPLLCTPYTPILNGSYNQYLDEAKALLVKYENEKDWVQYFGVYADPFRLKMFESLCDSLPISDKEYWETLAKLYLHTEKHHHNSRIYLRLFNSKRPCREYLMNDGERVTLASFPDRIPIYRGCSDCNIEGFGWTLRREKAEWFACRFQKPGKINVKRLIMVAKCKKPDVLAFFDRLDEKEILINPKKVKIEYSVPCGERPPFPMPLTDDEIERKKGLENRTEIDASIAA